MSGDSPENKGENPGKFDMHPAGKDDFDAFQREFLHETQKDKGDLSARPNGKDASSVKQSIITCDTGDQILSITADRKDPLTGQTTPMIEQIVSMPDGQKICTLSIGDRPTVVGLYTKTGEFAKPVYRATSPVDPPIDAWAYDDGTRVTAQAGKLTFKFTSGDEIVVDKNGLCSAQRGNKRYEDHEWETGKVTLFPDTNAVSFEF